MLRPHTPLFNVASDAPDAGGQGEAAPKATIGQQLRAALSSKSDLTAKLDAATDSLAVITAERDTARAELATAQARITELEAQLGEVNAALGEHEKEVAALKAADKDLDKRSSEQAKLIVRGVGVQASEMPASQTGEEASDAKVMTYAAFQKLNHTQRNEFKRNGGRIVG